MPAGLIFFALTNNHHRMLKALFQCILIDIPFEYWTYDNFYDFSVKEVENKYGIPMITGFPVADMEETVDENGKEIEGNGVSGNLCIKFPWPGMLRTTYGDHERCKQTYFSTYENLSHSSYC